MKHVISLFILGAILLFGLAFLLSQKAVVVAVAVFLLVAVCISLNILR